MIAEKDIVTKKYLKSQLDPIHKELGKIKNELSELRLDIEGKFIKFEVRIVDRLRSEIHQSIQSSIQNLESKQRLESQQYIGAMVEQHKEDMKAFWDGLKGNTDQI